jgi:hypothetical protein
MKGMIMDNSLNVLVEKIISLLDDDLLWNTKEETTEERKKTLKEKVFEEISKWATTR